MPNPSGPSKPLVFLSAEDVAAERVFPIRNLLFGNAAGASEQDTDSVVTPVPITEDVIATEPTQSQSVLPSQSQLQSHGPAEQNVPASESNFEDPPYPPIPPEDVIRKLSISGSESCYSRIRTERSQLVPSASGPPGIAQGQVSRDGHVSLYKCEDEPIHIPGSIQSFGVLLALRYSESGSLDVRIASENSRQLLEYGPEQLFGLSSFLDVLDSETREDMITRISHALDNSKGSKALKADTDLDVFPVTLLLPQGTYKQLWCAIHVSQGTEDLIICEFEAHSDVFYPEEMRAATAMPEAPTRILSDVEVSPAERLKSTTSKSKPLRVLDVVRRRKQSRLSSMDIFNAIAEAQQQLAAARSIKEIFEVVVGITSELTGFHRVMFYQFDAQHNGCVEAELVCPQASDDLYLGLHFPASDIPRQARELYKINRIRILYDRDAETARLVCREESDFRLPLDLTHSFLRAISPVHLKYLDNMGVRSTMSVSVIIDGELWGMIVCHHYGDKGLRVTLPMRELCRNIGQCAATNIEKLVMLQRIEARSGPKHAPLAQNPVGFIAASSADLLRVFQADFGLLSIQDEARAIGKLDPYREALAIVAYLQGRRFNEIRSSQNINVDFPEIKYEPGIHILSGLLIIPLSIGGKDFLVFFRKGQLKQVTWAGNPHDKSNKAGTEYLNPRTSFQRWTETVRGMSKEWTYDQLETASVLSLLYGRFIEIWRQKEVAGRHNRMTRLLIQNSSHEVRTPLNAIVNYLELALEDKLEDSTRDILQKAHKASKSLIYVIDDLLNLTKAEEGPLISPDESFDLSATVTEVVTQFRREAIRKNLDLTLSTHQGLPEMVKGDGARLRQVLSNITSNAFQHCLTGGVKIDIAPVTSMENSTIVCLTVTDTGIGMSEAQLDELFQEFEQVIDEESRPFSENTTPSSDAEGSQSLGIGLAVVARYVRNMKGQIKVKSEPSKGTMFAIELPFEHAEPESNDWMLQRMSSGGLDNPIPAFSTTSETSSVPLTFSYSTLQKQPEHNKPVQILDLTTPDPAALSPSMDSTGSSSPMINRGLGTEGSTSYPFPLMSQSEDSSAEGSGRKPLRVLIAEDNPINSRLLIRRLLKLGHAVELETDGQQCYDKYTSNLRGFDAILMDIQMPLVDGVISTKMIRLFEAELESPPHLQQRIPIIAVSASLKEEHRLDYIRHGFDAWILKPVDFGRLDFILQGIKSPELRQQALYAPGCWENGGWLSS